MIAVLNKFTTVVKLLTLWIVVQWSKRVHQRGASGSRELKPAVQSNSSMTQEHLALTKRPRMAVAPKWDHRSLFTLAEESNPLSVLLKIAVNFKPLR